MTIENSGICQFPKELLLEVLSYLDIQSLRKIREISKQFLELASHSRLWQSHFYHKFPKATLQSNDNNYFELFKQWSGYWHSDSVTLSSFKTKPFSCMAANENVVVLGGNLFAGGDVNRDRELRIWDIHTLKELGVLKGHTHGVRCLALQGDFVVSGTLNGEVRVGNWRTLESLGALEKHADCVTCLAMHGDLVISGSLDKTLHISNYRTLESLAILKEHIASITCLAVYENTVVAGAGNGSLCLWDLRTFERLGANQPHVFSVTCLAIDKHSIVAGLEDGSISVYAYPPLTLRGMYHENAEEEDEEGNLGQEFSTACVALPQQPGILIVGYYNIEKLSFWDLLIPPDEEISEWGRQIDCFRKPHADAINCLATQGNIAVSGCADGTLGLWNIRRHSFIHLLKSEYTKWRIEDSVTYLSIHGDTIISGASINGRICIWKFQEEKSNSPPAKRQHA